MLISVARYCPSDGNKVTHLLFRNPQFEYDVRCVLCSQRYAYFLQKYQASNDHRGVLPYRNGVYLYVFLNGITICRWDLMS